MPDLPRGGAPSGKSRKSESHENVFAFYGVVYVNDVGRKGLLNRDKSQLPVGTVIVREKLAHENAEKPELLVVMVKRERGFNKKANDWEFLMIDGSVNNIIRREKTGGCRNCHKEQKNNDFVFRTYLQKEE